MKKTLLLSLALFLGVASQSFAAGKKVDKALKNGFSLNLEIGFPSSDYGTPTSPFMEDEKMEMGFGKILGLQLGNRWYVYRENQVGVAIMANWIDFSITSGSEDDFTTAAMNTSFLEFGPMGTFSLGNDMALDAYYNLCPTMLITGGVSDGDDETTLAYGGFGFTHALGAAFRYKVFNLGLEYAMGSIHSAGTLTSKAFDDNAFPIDDQKISAANFRILLGFKF